MEIKHPTVCCSVLMYLMWPNETTIQHCCIQNSVLHAIVPPGILGERPGNPTRVHVMEGNNVGILK